MIREKQKIIVLIIAAIINLYFVSSVYSQERRDPFKHWFPKKKEVNVEEIKQKIIESVQKPERMFDISGYIVEGLIWGAYKPKAIINKDIYGVGDKLGEAIITKIEKEGITLNFEKKDYVIVTKSALNKKSAESEDESSRRRKESRDDYF